MAKELILRGLVQGVFCRNYCAQYGRLMKIRGSATNLSNGTVKVLLETDDMNLVNQYVVSLKINPRGITFYGSIDHIELDDYNGPITGDYRF